VSTYFTIRAVQNQRLGAGLSVQKRQLCAQNRLALAQNLHKKTDWKNNDGIRIAAPGAAVEEASD